MELVNSDRIPPDKSALDAIEFSFCIAAGAFAALPGQTPAGVVWSMASPSFQVTAVGFMAPFDTVVIASVRAQEEFEFGWVNGIADTSRLRWPGALLQAKAITLTLEAFGHEMLSIPQVFEPGQCPAAVTVEDFMDAAALAANLCE